jgi:hypothetical protein
MGGIGWWRPTGLVRPIVLGAAWKRAATVIENLIYSNFFSFSFLFEYKNHERGQQGVATDEYITRTTTWRPLFLLRGLLLVALKINIFLKSPCGYDNWFLPPLDEIFNMIVGQSQAYIQRSSCSIIKFNFIDFSITTGNDGGCRRPR